MAHKQRQFYTDPQVEVLALVIYTVEMEQALSDLM